MNTHEEIWATIQNEVAYLNGGSLDARKGSLAEQAANIAPVKPSREDVARVICSYSGPLGTHYMDVALAVADAVLALLPGRTVEETYHDEYTLAKVYWALGRCGLGDVQITDAVNEMQNAGILFRERGESNV